MTTVWQFVLHPALGPVNAIIKVFGLDPVAFLSTPSLLIPTIAASGIWQVLGFNLVLFLAGLTAMPKDLREAARLDGAKAPLDQFLTVTWPQLGPTTLVVLVTSMPAFKVFETAVLTKGRFNLSLEGFEHSNTGYAAALTLVFLGIVLLLSIVQVIMAVPAAYALAKLRFRGRGALFAAVVGALWVPVQALALLLFVGLARLQLLNTCIAMMKPFFRSVFAIFSVVAHWNDLFWPLIVVIDTNLAPLTSGNAVLFRHRIGVQLRGPHGQGHPHHRAHSRPFLRVAPAFHREHHMTGIK